MTDKTEIEALVAVERIECVSYATGFEEPTDPIWRICIGEYGADFDYELAAQNVADAINKAHAAALTALQADLAAAVARAEKAEVAMSKAATDVLAERARQVSAEEWTEDHDDAHTEGELAKAAGCYAWIAAQSDNLRAAFDRPPPTWPTEWDEDWWKPTHRRRDLVKAGALILAEIERLDRAALPDAKGGE